VRSVAAAGAVAAQARLRRNGCSSRTRPSPPAHGVCGCAAGAQWHRRVAGYIGREPASGLSLRISPPAGRWGRRFARPPLLACRGRARLLIRPGDRLQDHRSGSQERAVTGFKLASSLPWAGAPSCHPPLRPMVASRQGLALGARSIDHDHLGKVVFNRFGSSPRC